VSPAIVVPQLLKLQEQGFGVHEGIPTLVMAASSCDDVLAISLFTVFLGVAFSTGINNVAVERATACFLL
jgi:NhaP-type Na+/H+ or K+/H+ antiporter